MREVLAEMSIKNEWRGPSGEGRDAMVVNRLPNHPVFLALPCPFFKNPASFLVRLSALIVLPSLWVSSSWRKGLNPAPLRSVLAVRLGQPVGC